MTDNAADDIMEIFPIMKRKDAAFYHAHCTKDTVLEVLEARAEAIRAGLPYQTHLNLPPVHRPMAKATSSPSPSGHAASPNPPSGHPTSIPRGRSMMNELRFIRIHAMAYLRGAMCKQ
jgi:hypothetical protein